VAVHIDREDSFRGLLYFGKDCLHAGGLPCPRQASQDGVDRAGAMEPGPQAEGEVLHLGIPVIELLRDMGEFENIMVPEQGMVRITKIRWHVPSGCRSSC